MRDERHRQTRRIPVASKSPIVPSDAPRKHHTWEIRHSFEPIRDVGSAGRGESVAGARRTCGFGKIRQFADLESSFVTFLCHNCLRVARARSTAAPAFEYRSMDSLAAVRRVLMRRAIAQKGSPALRWLSIAGYEG
jgi:hypothetical protein